MEGRGFKSHLGLGFFRVYVSPRIYIIYTKSSCSKLTVEADNTLNLVALKRSEVLSFFTRLQRLVSARSVCLEDSIFQRRVPLYATEPFVKRVLKRGTSNESRALIEYYRLRFFAIQLVRVLGSLPL